MIDAKMHLYALWSQYSKKWMYHATTTDMTSQGWILVEYKDVSFDEPSPKADWSVAAIAATRIEQSRIRAEAEGKCTILNEHIASMLAIESK